ncbi:MAG: chemotaxis protein MotB [Gammaproteobacteria bacterium]|jgi:chemotaxis protein MotB
MDDEAPAGGDDDEGGGWIMTFADLMSLLMCFFVLLLSFAEIDLNKFKAISGSLKLAFGVQREVKAAEIPMGTSIIAQEFSPAQPQPTSINEVRQSTVDPNKQTLEFTDALEGDTGSENADGTSAMEALKAAATAADAQALIESLREEIDKGMIQIETAGTKIIIRIREKGSFPSGAAGFSPDFLPVTKKLRESLGEIEGTIVVAGHTDNIPIKTARFRSNWELSASRAVTVVHELLSDGELQAGRFLVEGHGDAHPLAPNDTSANRSLNRRVEMIIQQDQSDDVPSEQPLATLGADNDGEGDITASVASDITANNPNQLGTRGSSVTE